MISFPRIEVLTLWCGLLVLLWLPDTANAWLFEGILQGIFCILFGCDLDSALLGSVKLDFYRTFEEKVRIAGPTKFP